MHSHRSPRQPSSRPRQKPYARKQSSPRPGSIMSTIKSIVTAPLSWFAGNTEFEDTPGKRRRLAVPNSPRDGIQQEPRVAKRQRVASPSPEPVQGYLDPPQFLFNSTPKSDLRPQGTQSSAFSPVSLNIPPNFQEKRQQHHQQDRLERHAHSSIQPISYPQPELLRKDYTDLPPHQRPIARDPSMVSLPQSREHSSVSVSRDHSVGPARTPFRIRTTLSPHPSGAEYGPKPHRRERDPSAPPPLTALMSNPIFVKPPPDVCPIQRSLSAQPTVTLGSLTQSQRPVCCCVFP
jgi:nucleoporin NUP1